jgi:DNA-binding MarR family transcriptional regulator
VRRVDNPSDRRSSLLQLTADGRRIVDAGSAIIREELSTRLGGADLVAFAATIDHLLDAAAHPQRS